MQSTLLWRALQNFMEECRRNWVISKISVSLQFGWAWWSYSSLLTQFHWDCSIQVGSISKAVQLAEPSRLKFYHCPNCVRNVIQSRLFLLLSTGLLTFVISLVGVVNLHGNELDGSLPTADLTPKTLCKENMHWACVSFVCFYESQFGLCGFSFFTFVDVTQRALT